MAKMVLFFLAGGVFLSNIVSAQIIRGADSVIIKHFYFEDKQLSEFFDRFNYKEPVKLANKIPSTRAHNIITLINLKDVQLCKSSEATRFVKFVSDDSNKIRLAYEDKNWFAIAKCTFLYENKSCDIDILLRPDGDEKSGYKWIMYNARSDIFNFISTKDDNKEFIDPANHEVGFTELSAALHKSDNNWANFVARNYSADNLACLLIMIKTGTLKFIQINSIDFQFLQVPGWFFTVSNFNRKDYNSGWLISSIKKMDSAEKKDFIKRSLISN